MRRCIDCEYYRPYQGVYECWNRDSDFMYKQTLPDNSCPEFDEKEASRPGANALKQQTAPETPAITRREQEGGGR